MDLSLVDAFAAQASPEAQAIVRRLVQVIQEAGYPLDMAVKWGRLTFAQSADFHHWICGITITKKWVGLVFHFGGLLQDPGCVFKAGTSKFGRTLQYQSVEAVDTAIVQGFLAQALDRLPFFKAHWQEISKSA